MAGRKKKGTKISGLAGSWKMTDKEAEEMLAAIDEAWKKWRLPDEALQPFGEPPEDRNVKKKGDSRSISTEA